jgi:hypothetical protein
LRHIEPIIAVVALPLLKDVLEPPKLVEQAHLQAIATGPQTHAAVEGALEHR